jgi:hypothetical protein
MKPVMRYACRDGNYSIQVSHYCQSKGEKKVRKVPDLQTAGAKRDIEAKTTDLLDLFWWIVDFPIGHGYLLLQSFKVLCSRDGET